MSQRTEEILQRYRAAQSLGEADRARLLGAIRDRIANGTGIPKPGDAHTHSAGTSLAKTASIVPKIVVGFTLAAASAAYVARGSLAHIASVALGSPVASIAPKGAPDLKVGDVPEPASASSTWAPVSEEAPASALASARSVAPVNAESRSGDARSVRSRSQRPRAIESAVHASVPEQELARAPLEVPFDTADAPLPITALASTPAPKPASTPTPGSTPISALPSAMSPASTVTPAPVASHATNEVDEEVRLIGLAYSLLRDGVPARALAVLEEHERRFPNGRLAESRRVTRILALCQSGRTADAQAERDRFLSLYPRSPFSNRVRMACGSTAAP